MKFTLLAATLASVLVLAAADDSSASLRGSSDFGEQELDQVRIPAEAAVRVAKKPTKKPTKKPHKKPSKNRSPSSRSYDPNDCDQKPKNCNECKKFCSGSNKEACKDKKCSLEELMLYYPEDFDQDVRIPAEAAVRMTKSKDDDDDNFNPNKCSQKPKNCNECKKFCSGSNKENCKDEKCSLEELMLYYPEDFDQDVRIPAEAAVRLAKKPTKKPTKKPNKKPSKNRSNDDDDDKFYPKDCSETPKNCNQCKKFCTGSNKEACKNRKCSFEELMLYYPEDFDEAIHGSQQ